MPPVGDGEDADRFGAAAHRRCRDLTKHENGRSCLEYRFQTAPLGRREVFLDVGDYVVDDAIVLRISPRVLEQDFWGASPLVVASPATL